MMSQPADSNTMYLYYAVTFMFTTKLLEIESWINRNSM